MKDRNYFKEKKKEKGKSLILCPPGAYNSISGVSSSTYNRTIGLNTGTLSIKVYETQDTRAKKQKIREGCTDAVRSETILEGEKYLTYATGT